MVYIWINYIEHIVLLRVGKKK